VVLRIRERTKIAAYNRESTDGDAILKMLRILKTLGFTGFRRIMPRLLKRVPYLSVTGNGYFNICKFSSASAEERMRTALEKGACCSQGNLVRKGRCSPWTVLTTFADRIGGLLQAALRREIYTYNALKPV